jgi:hypothetical protein
MDPNAFVSILPALPKRTTGFDGNAEPKFVVLPSALPVHQLAGTQQLTIFLLNPSS